MNVDDTRCQEEESSRMEEVKSPKSINDSANNNIDDDNDNDVENVDDVNDEHESIGNYVKQVEEETLERSKIVFRGRPYDEDHYEDQDSHCEQEEESFDSTFDSMNSNHHQDRNEKEHEVRASDLEMRLESFKDHASSSKIQQQDPFEVRRPQNPCKQQQRDDYDDDFRLCDNTRNEDENIRDLEQDTFKQRDSKDMFKSPNPHEKTRILRMIKMFTMLLLTLMIFTFLQVLLLRLTL